MACAINWTSVDWWFYNDFIQSNTSKNAICKMLAILFRPQCVNSLSVFDDVKF